MNTLGNIAEHLKNLLTSPLKVGALELSATAVKYLTIRGGSILQASLRLPPGIIEKGVIVNRPLLIAALKNLHNQILPDAQAPINVIATIPSHVIYAQSFTVPLVASEHLEESIRLNLQMISPNNIEDSYYDYQEIQTNKDLANIDLLGAFAPSGPVHGYEQALRETGFVPVAVEFPGLALARLVRERWGGIEATQDYLLIHIGGEGVLLLILKNGNLTFHHFTPWSDLGTTESTGPLSFSTIKSFLDRELQRVLNFYLSRTGKPITEAILVSPVFNYEIVQLASEKLHLKVRNLSIAELPKLQPSWFTVLGSALRGSRSQASDTDVSLSATTTQTEYYQERLHGFIATWRNIIIGSLVIVLIAFTLVDSVFTKENGRIEHRLQAEFTAEELKNTKSIQETITTFNSLLDLIERTGKNEVPWSPFLVELQKIAGKDIAFDRVYLNGGVSDSHGLVAARATNDAAALAFKERLMADAHIKSVSLPLAEIKALSDRTASFNITFTASGLAAK